MGVATALKACNPAIKVVGVESSGAPGMTRSVREGSLVTLDTVDCIIDGLRVRRVGELNFSVVQRFVDDVVALPDKEIFDAMIWVMERCKLVVEGAAAVNTAVTGNFTTQSQIEQASSTARAELSGMKRQISAAVTKLKALPNEEGWKQAFQDVASCHAVANG